MGVIHATDSVTVWFEDALPTRLVWQGERYVVTDTPTSLSDEAVLHDWANHLRISGAGWRFQATSAVDGDVRVFDIEQRGDRWEVVAVYA